MSNTRQLFEVLVWTVNGEVVQPMLVSPFLVIANEQSEALIKGIDLAKRTYSKSITEDTQFFATLKTSYRGMLRRQDE